LLIVDQPAGDFDHVGILLWGYTGDGDGCYDVAADLYREEPSRRIVLIGSTATRAEQADALPSFEAISRRELKARGVPPEVVSFVRGKRPNDRETARALASWLAEHPTGSVLLLANQFHSATVRHSLDAIIAPADAARVHVRSLPNRQHDDTNWWRRRSGYRAFAANWLLQLQSWLGSGEAAAAIDGDAEQYERAFLDTLPRRSP
jgi:hypothetical protein